jgi:DhnA family fructose-bisphosphate aldolase class Ia
MSSPASGYEFNLEVFFPERIFRAITDVRVNDPRIIEKSALRRRRRQRLTSDGKLAILACDHPARGITKSGNDPLLMGDRQQYLGRALRVITSPEFDGVMGTTDIIEDLLIMDQLVVDQGGQSFLDNKVLIGCMNRGGLSNTSFEMDDRFTSFTAESINHLRLDGAKFMFRLDMKDDRSLRTIESCARAVTELNKYSIPVFVEAFSVERVADGYKMVRTPEGLIKTIGVATALGDSSRGIWLKIPYCDGFDAVAKATTCPILMLGGESLGDPAPVLREFSKGLAAGSNVRGALVGRNILFPGQEDPSAVANAVSRIVHQNYSAEQAISHIADVHGKALDALTAFLK